MSAAPISTLLLVEDSAADVRLTQEAFQVTNVKASLIFGLSGLSCHGRGTGA